jgi:Tfp pilus assembly protein PilF
MKTIFFTLLLTSLVGCTKQQTAPQPPAEPPATTNSVQPPSAQASGNQKVAEGKALFDANQLDQAEQKFKEALKQNPTNQAAYYYLNLILEKRQGR